LLEDNKDLESESGAMIAEQSSKEEYPQITTRHKVVSRDVSTYHTGKFLLHIGETAKHYDLLDAFRAHGCAQIKDHW
jgi:hypothetical protein